MAHLQATNSRCGSFAKTSMCIVPKQEPSPQIHKLSPGERDISCSQLLLITSFQGKGPCHFRTIRHIRAAMPLEDKGEVDLDGIMKVYSRGFLNAWQGLSASGRCGPVTNEPETLPVKTDLPNTFSDTPPAYGRQNSRSLTIMGALAIQDPAACRAENPRTAPAAP